MATLYVGSDQTYKTIQEAINAASTTEETTIILSAGTYAEDVNITVAAVGEQKGNIKIAAAEGADVTVSGLVTIGYYEKRVGSQSWNAEIAFEGITFDQATAATHSIDIQQVKDFNMTNCKVIGDGEYGMLGTTVDNGATISQCIFENAGIQSAGSFGSNMLIADCIFNESKVNIQSGNSVMVRNCTFNSTLKEANVDDSFYCIRSNDNAITLNGCQFNIDSELTSVASDQAKWGVLWQRNAGGTQWKAFNCQFNLTDAAMQQSELLVNKNGTTTDANKAGRIVIYAFNSAENDVADLLAKTEGIITVVADAKYAVYDNGVPVGDVVDVSNIYIDNRYTADNVGELVLGINAFTAVDSRVMAIAASAKATLTVNEGAVVEHDTTISNTIIHKDSEDWFYTDYLREDGFVAKNVKVDGTFKAYHIILNNADTVVSTTGRIRTDEDLRILGGTFTATGSRNGETADDLYTGSWGNDIAWTDAAQFKVSYLKVVYGAEAVFNNSNIVVWAQSVDVGTYWTATADNPSTGTLTLNDSYMIVGDWNTISVADNSVLNLNGSTIQADNDANSGFRAKMVLNGTLNMSADSLLVLGDMTVGDNGKIVIDAANFTGTKKLIDLNDNESLDGKVTFTNLADNVRVIYGADGDVTLSDADMTKLYVNAAFTENNLAAGQELGINAFTSFVAALKAVTADTDTIEVTGAITEDIPAEAMNVVLSKDLAITGTDAVVTLNNGGYKKLIFSAADGAEDIDVSFSGVELVAGKTQIIFGDVVTDDSGAVTGTLPVKVRIDATSTVSAYVVAVEDGSTVDVLEGGKFFSTGEVMNVKGTLNASGNEAFDTTAALTAADRQIIAHYMWNYGSVNFTDTYASIYSQLRLRGADSVLTADNSVINLGMKVDGSWLANPSANGVGWANIDGTLNLTNNSVLKANGATGKDGYALTVNSGAEFNVESGSTAEFSAGVKNDGTIKVDNGTLITGNSWTAPGTQPPATALVNNGTIEVSGESTLNIAELSGNTIDFMDGAIIKDSTVGGGVFVAGNVTFRGDNTFGMITDFGTLTDYYGTTAPMAWTVEAGASVTLNNKARYGLGYGDKVVINGEIAENGAAAARAALNDDDASNDVKQSLFMHGLVAQESAGWNCDSSFTVNNAFVTIGSNSSFGSKAGNYGGNYTFSFNNSVLNASRITFYNTNAKTTFTLTGSDVEIGQFMTRDQDSMFTLDNTKLYSTSTINGNDEGQYNAGTLNVLNGSTLTYTSAMTNEATGKIVISADSKLIAPEIIMVDGASITIDGTGFTSGTNKVIDLNINGSLKDAVTAENLEEGITLAYGKDGDVLITDANTGKLYVSQDYAGKEFGYIDGDKVVGVNAFALLADALDAKTAATEEIVIGSNLEEALSGKTVSGKLTAESAVTVTDSANSGYVNFTGTTLGENITVDAKYFYLYGENTFNGDVKSSTTFYSSGKLTLTGNAEVYTAMSRYYVNADDGIYVVGTAAAGEGKNAAVQFKANNYLGHYSGTFSVKDTAASFGYILLNGDTDGDGYSQAQLVLDNAKVSTIGGPNTQPGQVLMNGDSAIVATNGSVLDFRGPKDFGYLSMTANNSITLTDSEMYLGKDGQSTSTLAGKITLTNSTLNSLGKLNSTAAITIDETSSIVATAITGTGTITIDVKGYTGDTFKAIDVNSAIANTVKLTNASNKYYLTYGEDGDVYVNKSPEFVYVSSDYNSSTDGWGVTKFGSWDGAYAFTSVNAKKATIVFEKTTTISGNCFPKQADGVAAIIVKDGAAVGNANSKWDAVFAMTIEAGGILQSARPANAGYGNTHVKNKWIIGEAGADKQAKVLFINGKNGINYKTMSIALLSGFNRSITTNNALIEVGDLGLQSTASFTDTTLTIDGILAIKGTSLYKTTMTDTTVTVKGHNLMNENTYYSTVGTILATLTMDNSSITVDDGADTTAAEKVWLGYTGNVAQTLTMTNNSSITIEKGAEVEVANKVVMTDSSISAGNINAGNTKYAGSNSFYFNQLEKGKVYYAVLYDAEGNELETIVRTSTSGSTFYPKFAVQPVGTYTAKCFKDEAKTELHQEKTYTFTAVGTMELTNSELYGEKITLAGNNLTMDYKSTIGFNSIEGGYITVSDAASYVDNEGVDDGTYKLFDYTGTGTMTADDYKALLNNQWHDNYLLLNNDLFLTDQQLGTLYVNSAWAGSEIGEVVDGHLYGFNAASSMSEVTNMIATDGSDTTVKLQSDLTVAGDMVYNYGSGDVTFAADSAVTVTQSSSACGFYFITGQDADAASTITVGENVTFELSDNVSDFAVWYGASLTVDGTIKGGANWGSLYLFYGDEHVINATGTVATGRVQAGFTDLTVNGGTIDTNYLLIEGGKFTATGATLDLGAVHDTNNGGMRYGASEFYISDSDVKATGITLKYGETVAEVTDSKVAVSGNVNLGTGLDISGGEFSAASTKLGSYTLFSGLTKGAAREITVALVKEGETSGKTITVNVGANADTAEFYSQDIADGTYNITVLDGNNVFSGQVTFTNGSVVLDGGKFTSGELSIGNGAFDVYGESTVVIDTQSGTINVHDGAVMTDSKVGKVNVYGKNVWQGTNTIGDMSIGWYNSGADIETTITGTATVNNFMIGNVEGFTSTLNIGDAAGNRTTINGNQHNYTSNSIVNVNNADVTGNYVSMTGVVNVTDSTYSKFGDFRVVSGSDHTVDPKVTFTRSSITGSYGYIGGWSATSSGYGILELKDNSTWKSTGGSLTTANSEVSVDASSFIVGGTFTNNGKFTAANGSTVTAGTVNNGGTITLTDSTFTGKVNNTGSFTVGGASALDISSFVGKLDIAAGTEFSSFSVNMTGDADSVVAADDLTLVWNTLLGAETLTVADKLAFTGVELPTTSAVTVFAGAATYGSLEINGYGVLDNQIMVGGQLYDVTSDSTGITLNVSSEVYTPISGGITGVTQGEGTYTFTVTDDLTGGEGEYIILFDLGSSLNMYCADISRTFPVNGKFSERQKQIYNIVLAGQAHVLSHTKPGITTKELNQKLVEFYAVELKKIGLIKEDKEVMKYYYHGVSHHLGLDCHDLCEYTPLEAGAIITCEPGLYIAEENIGIRIEDDILITEDGYINLSSQIIKTVEDIENYLRK